MAAPANINEFLDLVRKSGVLEDKRLDAYLSQNQEPLPSEPNKLAGVFVRDGLLTHFQAEQILLGKWRRFTIGKYKVLERLGSGGMGSVYLCEHKLMRRRVAVKVLPTAKAADSASLERFYREARAVAALDHNNIVHAYDIDQDESLHFLVMEYVDGASLQEIVKRSGQIDYTRAAHYMRQAAIGLDHAHRAGLVHRDIKPGNILVDRTGVVKILDMGLARFFNDEEDNLTKKYDENVLGTADYLSPEQAIDSHGVDIRADIYSLGATFYFMLTCKTPFGEGTVAQKLIWHQTRQPKPLSGMRRDVPPELEAIIVKMMAKDPAQRFQTPAELAEALEPWTQMAIEPPPDSEMPRLSLAATGVNYGEPSMVGQPAGPSSNSNQRKSWQVTAPSAVKGPATPAPMPLANSPRAEAKLTTLAGPTTPSLSPPPRPRQAAAAAEVQVKAPPPLNPERPDLAPLPAVPKQMLDKVDSVPWENIAAETAEMTAADTPSSRVKLGPAKALLQERRRTWLVLGLVSAALLLGLVSTAIVFGLFASRPALANVPLTVSKDKPAKFHSVRAALEQAKSGDRIVLLDRELREQLSVDGSQRPISNLIFEAEQGVAYWYPTAADDTPLLALSGVKGWHFKNIVFVGENRVEKLVTLTGYCPKLTFEDVTLRDFRICGLSVTNCAGKADEPITLLRVRTENSGKNRPQAAVIFNANARIAPPDNRHFLFKDCRFDGTFSEPHAVSFRKERTPESDIKFVGTTPVQP